MSAKPQLAGQTVVVIGGSSGIGLETARRARAEGADVIVTARDPDRLTRAGRELGARTSAFDATAFEQLGRFFDELPTPIDHVLVTGPGPYYAPLAEFDVERARRDLEAHILLPLQVARNAAGKVRPGGTLLFMGGSLHYDWSDPNRIVMKTTDSNLWGGGSGHTYTFTRRPDGKTDLDAVVVREGKNIRGRLLGFVLGTIGRGVLEKAFESSVKAIEARNGTYST